MPARLSIHIPDDAVLQVIVDDAANATLGRETECNFTIDHPSVSRRHARLLHAGDAWMLFDLGSKNGTRIGGRIIREALLDSHQWFAVGDVFCEFEVIDELELARWQAHANERRQTSAIWSSRLDGRKGAHQLLGALLKGIVEVAECERGFLLVPDLSGDMRVRACLGMSVSNIADTGFSGSRGAVELAITRRQPVYLSNRVDDGSLRNRESIVMRDIHSLVCLPLADNGDLNGVVYADTTDEAKTFTNLDAQLLTAFAEHAASALSAMKLGDELADISAWLSIDAAGATQLRTSAPIWRDLTPGKAAERVRP